MSKKSTSKPVTEVLWSRAGETSFGNEEFAQESSYIFSENGTSSSSSSFGFDDYEMKSVQRIRASLDAIDSALYEEKHNPVLSQELFDECQKWSKRFTHLKLEGRQISASDQLNEAGSRQKTYFSDSQSQHVPTSNTSRNESSTKKDVSNCSRTICDFDKCFSSLERIGDKNGTMLELEDVTPLSMDNIKEKIIIQLAARIWADVILTWNEKADEESLDFRETSRLPPINTGIKPSGSPTKTKEKPVVNDMPKLEGILTISPKVLSNRIFSNSRPNTGVSVSSRLLSARSVLPQHDNWSRYSLDNTKKKNVSDASLHSPRAQSKRNFERDLDFINLYLPVLEEDGVDSFSTGLHGLHIDPKSKEKISKLSDSPKHVQISLRPPSRLLPPIDVNAYTAVYDNGEIPRPISYDSCASTANKGRKNGSLYARHLNNVNSSPSTAKSPESPVFNPGKLTRQSSPLCTKGSGKRNRNAFPYYKNGSSLSTTSKMPLPSNLVSMFPKATKSVEPSEIFRKKSSVHSKPNKSLGALYHKASR